MRTPFTGAGTALVTPFTRNGDLDEAAVRRMGRRQIDGGWRELKLNNYVHSSLRRQPLQVAAQLARYQA